MRAADAKKRAGWSRSGLAAQYLRMSTDAQVYSPKIQSSTIRAYAEAHDLEVVRTYLDSGKSGLTLAGRPALMQLLNDVTGGQNEFGVLLVYDISRWGRFQDTDESAYYEYILKSAGLQIVYVAEQFTNDASPFSAVFKSMKRAMAAEFSRELSNKIAAGHKLQARRGFWQGARPGYALRRVLVDDDRGRKRLLKNGERKALMTDRVVIEPGPRREVEAVRFIFESYVAGATTVDIAKDLERLGFPRIGICEWDYHRVDKILRSEKYAGTNIYGRTLQRLKRPIVPLPEDQWVIVKGAFPPVVSPELYQQAQSRRTSLYRHWTDEQYLEALRGIWAREGRLTRFIIDADQDTPDSASYYHRFGNLTKLYSLIGYETQSLEGPLPEGTLRVKRVAVLRRALAYFRAVGASPHMCGSNQIELNGRITMQLQVRHCVPSRRGAHWTMEIDSKYLPDYMVLARLHLSGESVRDYLIIPTAAPEFKRYQLFRETNPLFDRYLSKDLSPLAKFSKAKRSAAEV